MQDKKFLTHTNTIKAIRTGQPTAAALVVFMSCFLYPNICSTLLLPTEPLHRCQQKQRAAAINTEQKDTPQKQPPSYVNIMQGFIIIKAMMLFIF
jgi:hypothetical protein